MSYETPLLETYAVRSGELSIRSYFNFIHKISITMEAGSASRLVVIFNFPIDIETVLKFMYS